MTKDILHAVDEGDFERTKELLTGEPALAKAKGDHDVTPLHAAAEKNLAEITELLLDAGADLEQQTTWGMTPLQWAANMGSNAVAELLIARGAQLNLWAASGLGKLEAVHQFFIEPGHLRPGATQNKHLQQSNGSWEKDPHPEDQTETISNAFYIACRNGHSKVAQFLLEHGASIDFKGFLGGTGLHWAACNGHIETVKFLLKNNARQDLKDEQFHKTPRHWALEFGYSNIAVLFKQ